MVINHSLNGMILQERYLRQDLFQHTENAMGTGTIKPPKNSAYLNKETVVHTRT